MSTSKSRPVDLPGSLTTTRDTSAQYSGFLPVRNESTVKDHDATHSPSSPRGASPTSSQYSPTSTDYGDDSWVAEGSTPPWRKWSYSLQDLLGDPTGMDLFREYLDEERADQALLLHLACDGLKKEKREEKRVLLAKIMYKMFIQADRGLILMPETRARFDRAFGKGEEPKVAELMGILGAVQAETRRVLEEQLYPNFMQSEKYQLYINEQEERYGLDGASEVSASPPPEPPAPLRMDPGWPSAPSSDGAPARAPPVPPPPLHMPPNWPNLPSNPPPRPSPDEKERGVNGAPAVPPRTSTLSRAGGLTREALQSSVGPRIAENQHLADKVWENGEAAQRPFYVKYAQFSLPSAQDSELDSQVSAARRSAVSSGRPSGGVIGGIPGAQETAGSSRRYNLDYELAKENAKLNSNPSPDIVLPLTEHQRTVSTLNPKGYDPRSNKPSSFQPEQLASKLLTIIKQREAEGHSPQGDPPTLSPAVGRLLDLSKTPAGRPKIPHVPPEPDDSLHVLNAHSDRVGETETPPSNNSLCSSPQPHLRQKGYGTASTVAVSAVGARGGGGGRNWDPMDMGHGQGHGKQRPVPPKPSKDDRRTRPPDHFDFKPPGALHPRDPLRQLGRDISTDSGLGDASSLTPMQPHPFLALPSLREAAPPKTAARGPPPRRDMEGHQLQLKHSQVQGVLASAVSKNPRSRSSTGRHGNSAKTVKEEEGYTVVWQIGQKGDCFMTRMVGTNCLRGFRAVLPPNLHVGKNTRYYFREQFHGMTQPVWNEVKDDHATLPLFEGRINALVEL